MATIERNRAPEYEVFKYRTTYDVHSKMEKWCIDKFGERWSVTKNRSGKWCVFWAGREKPGNYRWCFVDEQDAIHFSLKW